MKTYIIILLIVCSNLILAQKPLDTIYANDKKNVALFFPNPIRQGIAGAEHVVFTYNREKEQYFGLLQAKYGEESNLLAITDDGRIYSYIVKYASKLSKLNYFISIEESIGNENSADNKTRQNNNILVNDYENKTIPKESYSNISEELILNKLGKNIRSKKDYQIKLSLNRIVYKNDRLYFIIEINNKSIIDYDLNFINFFIANKHGARRKSYQKLAIKPIFNYHLPTKIQGKTARKFIVVFKKFTLDDTKRFLIELNELSGERNLELKVSNKFIANPD